MTKDTLAIDILTLIASNIVLFASEMLIITMIFA